MQNKVLKIIGILAAMAVFPLVVWFTASSIEGQAMAIFVGIPFFVGAVIWIIQVIKQPQGKQYKTVREQEYAMSGERYGSFAVYQADIATPIDQYAFIFTRDKLIAARIGGTLTSTSQLLKDLESMPINAILEADKRNFEIPYDEISKLEVRKSLIVGGVIKIIGKEKEEYYIAEGQVYEDCVQIIQSAVPTKLELK